MVAERKVRHTKGAMAGWRRVPGKRDETQQMKRSGGAWASKVWTWSREKGQEWWQHWKLNWIKSGRRPESV